MRALAAGSTAFVLALAIALPAAAATLDRFTIDEVIQNEYSCGVVEVTKIHGEGTRLWDGESLVSISIHFVYEGTFTEPSTGRQITQRSHQNVTNRGGLFIATRGQGIFLRVGGEGVVFHDVGRLVFDPGNGSTLSATPKVLPFDDPTSGDRIDAAVCSMFD